MLAGIRPSPGNQNSNMGKQDPATLSLRALVRALSGGKIGINGTNTDIPNVRILEFLESQYLISERGSSETVPTLFKQRSQRSGLVGDRGLMAKKSDVAYPEDLAGLIQGVNFSPIFRKFFYLEGFRAFDERRLLYTIYNSTSHFLKKPTQL